MKRIGFLALALAATFVAGCASDCNRGGFFQRFRLRRHCADPCPCATAEALPGACCDGGLCAAGDACGTAGCCDGPLLGSPGTDFPATVPPVTTTPPPGLNGGPGTFPIDPPPPGRLSPEPPRDAQPVPAGPVSRGRYK